MLLKFAYLLNWQVNYKSKSNRGENFLEGKISLGDEKIHESFVLLLRNFLFMNKLKNT